MLIGYARQSAPDADLSVQRASLEACGCALVHTELGLDSDQPELWKAVQALQAGDTLVVGELGRLGRGLFDVLEVMKHIEARGAHLRSLCDELDTTQAPAGFVYRVASALANVERSQRCERAKRGLSAAKERGRQVGRPRKLSSEQVQHAQRRVASGESLPSIAADLRVSALTLRRALDVHRAAMRSAHIRRSA